MKPKPKLHAVTVSKTIYIISTDVDSIGSLEAIEMADNDGSSWDMESREFKKLVDVPSSDRHIIPHSDSRSFAARELSIEAFFDEMTKPRTYVDVKLRIEVDEDMQDPVKTITALVNNHLGDMKDASFVVDTDLVSATRRTETGDV